MPTTFASAGRQHASPFAFLSRSALCDLCFRGLWHHSAHHSKSNGPLRPLLLGNVCWNCDRGQLGNVAHSPLALTILSSSAKSDPTPLHRTSVSQQNLSAGKVPPHWYFL